MPCRDFTFYQEVAGMQSRPYLAMMQITYLESRKESERCEKVRCIKDGHRRTEVFRTGICHGFGMQNNRKAYGASEGRNARKRATDIEVHSSIGLSVIF